MDSILKDEKDSYIIKVLSYANLYEKDKENCELKNTILEICDKIISDFGSNEIVEEIKKLHSN